MLKNSLNFWGHSNIDKKINISYYDFNIPLRSYIYGIGLTDEGNPIPLITTRTTKDSVAAHELIGHFYDFMQIAENPNGKITDFHFINSKNTRIAGLLDY